MDPGKRTFSPLDSLQGAVDIEASQNRIPIDRLLSPQLHLSESARRVLRPLRTTQAKEGVAVQPIRVVHFSDVLCVWAYVSQIRMDELQHQFADAVVVEYRYF